ncbi:hypothetical protein V6V47_07415 [Micromonospora sp. CPCC 205539]|uniref:hypothetical protein n=1 Tax=Micromonospora sp. CPCC 205539 TaxID=3122408 RepID=UPI002FEFE754
MSMTRRLLRVGLWAGGLLVIGLAGFWIGRLTPTDVAAPSVRHGTVTAVNAAGTAFAVHADGSAPGNGYHTPRRWRDAQRSWHDDGQPECLAPLTTGQRIEFAVVRVEPDHDGVGGELVTWVKCPAR